ncbi:hypothetical protein AB0I72_19310 [Nocardiopsis sp. NPDC049922]|uniref:hypothetical protein n=1 Tax=Nocardiopsis sp. NPDC049922 TaxID=3155157 RepID=UPI0033E4CD1B
MSTHQEITEQLRELDSADEAEISRRLNAAMESDIWHHRYDAMRWESGADLDASGLPTDDRPDDEEVTDE